MKPRRPAGPEASESSIRQRSPRRFVLILGGGGARGLAHAGALRAFERMGWTPSAIVGVSMGAIIGAVYALREDWYSALLNFAKAGLPQIGSPVAQGAVRKRSKLKELASSTKVIWHLGRGWGAETGAVQAGRDALRDLVGRADLAEGRVPVAVSATDLLSGQRVVMRRGPAAEAVYASSALAGVFPPSPRGSQLLADGAYTDICPIDVAREYGCDCVVAVNPGRSHVVEGISTGLQAILRATEICYFQHASLRFEEADLVINPPFRRAIETLEFAAYRECIAAGMRGVREQSSALSRMRGD